MTGDVMLNEEVVKLEKILRRAHRLNQDLKLENSALQLEIDVLKDDIRNLGGVPSTIPPTNGAISGV